MGACARATTNDRCANRCQAVASCATDAVGCRLLMSCVSWWFQVMEETKQEVLKLLEEMEVPILRT